MVSLEKIKNTHPEKFRDDAYMISMIKAILQMYALSSTKSARIPKQIGKEGVLLCIVGIIS